MTILDVSSDLFKDTQSIESDLFKEDSLESDLFKADSVEDDLFKDDLSECQENISIELGLDTYVSTESYLFNIEDLQNVHIENGSLGKSLKEIIESNDNVEVIVFTNEGPAAYWVK